MKLLLVAAMVTACAHGGMMKKVSTEPVAPAASAPQSLFGKWQQENATTVIDLTGGSVQKEFYFKFLPAQGGTCLCLMDFKGGSQEGGKATMSDCEYKDNSASPNTDPGCQTLDGKYTYTCNGTSLSFTNVATKVTTPFRGIGGPGAATELAK